MNSDEKQCQIAVQVLDLERVYQVGGSQVRALQGVSLDVKSGEFLAIVGVSGSGKSTLLHLVGGLDSPTAGEIRVRGLELGKLTQFELSLYRREVVGFVFQSFYLVPEITAEANVRLALTFQGTYGSERQRLAAKALNRVGLADRAAHRPSQLSGGEQQRVAVARAIVHEPSLLLADEPTGNLDRQTAESLMSLFRELNQISGMSVIVVTHDQELASQFCDRTVRMRDGKLVEP